jgi:hypothetical protein
MKPVGEPDAGNPHVRFDERGWETELFFYRPPRPSSTLPKVKQRGRFALNCPIFWKWPVNLIRKTGFSCIRNEKNAKGLIIRTEKDAPVPEARVNGLDESGRKPLRF